VVHKGKVKAIAFTASGILHTAGGGERITTTVTQSANTAKFSFGMHPLPAVTQCPRERLFVSAPSGRTLLTFAAYRGEHEWLAAWIAHHGGLPSHAVLVRDCNGLCAVDYALEYGQLDSLQLLVSAAVRAPPAGRRVLLSSGRGTECTFVKMVREFPLLAADALEHWSETASPDGGPPRVQRAPGEVLTLSGATSVSPIKDHAVLKPRNSELWSSLGLKSEDDTQKTRQQRCDEERWHFDREPASPERRRALTQAEAAATEPSSRFGSWDDRWDPALADKNSRWDAESAKVDVLCCVVPALCCRGARPGDVLFRALVDVDLIDEDTSDRILNSRPMRAAIAFKWQVYGRYAWKRRLALFAAFYTSLVSGLLLLLTDHHLPNDSAVLRWLLGPTLLARQEFIGAGLLVLALLLTLHQARSEWRQWRHEQDKKEGGVLKLTAYAARIELAIS
jgi:hypothetical protein